MRKKLAVLGWREYVDLPDLQISGVKAKIDTGAKTSCIHAFAVETFEKDNEVWVRFGVHPNQGDRVTEVWCESRVVDYREVTDSGGHTEMRYVIASTLVIGRHVFEAEITLTNRDNMRFRMLLGRRAMKGRFAVNPGASYRQVKLSG
ncbi:MAG: ATP-dependent zinc protease [Leucothrix sp.]